MLCQHGLHDSLANISLFEPVVHSEPIFVILPCIYTSFQVDKNAEMIAKWKYCALSQEKLKRPIVACEMGR